MAVERLKVAYRKRDGRGVAFFATHRVPGYIPPLIQEGLCELTPEER